MSSKGKSGWRQHLELRLARYLADGQGCATVVGDDQDAIETVIARSAGSVPNVRVLSISARANGLATITSLLRGSIPAGAGHSPQFDAMLGEIAAARSGVLTLIIAVRDADMATPESLERIRIAAETFAAGSTPVRLVFSGGRFLPTLLEIPRLRGLATRVTARLELGA